MNFKKLGIISGIVFVGGIIFSYLIFPQILKKILYSQVQLKPGTMMREMWSEIPFPLFFKVYLFNVTNAEAVIAGGKPIVKEIGPYWFDEWKTKHNQVEDLEEDTITFNSLDIFNFRPDLSEGLTGKEILVMPNVLYLSIGLKVNKDRKPMLPLIDKATQDMFKPLSSFLSATAMEVMFDGVPVHCGSEEFAVKAVCGGMQDEARGLSKYNESTFLFSLFGPKNNSESGLWSAYRGVKNIHDLGRIIRYNGEPELEYWHDDECNELKGTDSTIFPPFLKHEEGLWAFEPDICRPVRAHYIGKSSYAGLPTSEYTLHIGNLADDEHSHCFCEDPPEGCPPDGMLDLTPCLGSPMFASLPHFYDTDPAVLAQVDGLSPNKESHAVFIHFEAKSGTPLSAAKRLQLSLHIEPIEELLPMKSLPDMYIPVLWVEEGAALNKTYTNMLKYQLFLGLKFNAVVKWSTFVIGLLGSIGGALMHFKGGDPTAAVVTVQSPPSPKASHNSADPIRSAIGSVSHGDTPKFEMNASRY